jgi:hypothetical protein
MNSYCVYLSIMCRGSNVTYLFCMNSNNVYFTAYNNSQYFKKYQIWAWFVTVLVLLLLSFKMSHNKSQWISCYIKQVTHWPISFSSCSVNQFYIGNDQTVTITRISAKRHFLLKNIFYGYHFVSFSQSMKHKIRLLRFSLRIFWFLNVDFMKTWISIYESSYFYHSNTTLIFPYWTQKNRKCVLSYALSDLMTMAIYFRLKVHYLCLLYFS